MEEDNTAAPSPRLGQDPSPVASIAGDMRDAWSCPLPNEVFEVGSQGQDEDIAGLGVAIALGKLLSAGCTPVRHVSHTADPLPLCLSPHLTILRHRPPVTRTILSWVIYHIFTPL